jgi:hypothetical protein
MKKYIFFSLAMICLLMACTNSQPPAEVTTKQEQAPSPATVIETLTYKEFDCYSDATPEKSLTIHWNSDGSWGGYINFCFEEDYNRRFDADYYDTYKSENGEVLNVFYFHTKLYQNDHFYSHRISMDNRFILQSEMQPVLQKFNPLIAELGRLRAIYSFFHANEETPPEAEYTMVEVDEYRVRTSVMDSFKIVYASEFDRIEKIVQTSHDVDAIREQLRKYASMTDYDGKLVEQAAKKVSKQVEVVHRPKGITFAPLEELVTKRDSVLQKLFALTKTYYLVE